MRIKPGDVHHARCPAQPQLSCLRPDLLCQNSSDYRCWPLNTVNKSMI
jgi:hypothetical protein